MKSKLLYLLLLIIVFGSGCVNTKNNNTPVPVPAGTFTGTFRKIHQTAKTGKLDTASAAIQITLNTTTGFTVTGDTTTLHAGSYGGYAIASTFIEFNDVTLPKIGVPVKIHLNGAYQYYFDGTVFQMLSNPSDTIAYQYDMKKVSN